MTNNEFADLMKTYEGEFTKIKVDPNLPICLRFDGKNFSTFTSDITRPFDERLTKIMTELAKYCLHITNGDYAYTQSDEISVVILPDENKTSLFGNKVQKISSVFAAKVSVRFNKLLQKYMPEKYVADDLDVISDDSDVVFDSRVWNVPTVDEALDTILWRMRDARKNSISMCVYASSTKHKDFLGMGTNDRLKYLEMINKSWDNYNEENKTGVVVMAKNVLVPYSDDEVEMMKKYAKPNAPIPEMKMKRSIETFTLPELLENPKEVKESLLNMRSENKLVNKQYKSATKNSKKIG